MNQTFTLNLHKLDCRTKAKSTLIVDLLKKRGIPGSMAARMFCLNSGEYLLRKCWLLDFQIERGYPVIDKRRWLLAAIKNDYNEPDKFLEWLKRKKEYIMKNGNADLKQLISI